MIIIISFLYIIIKKWLIFLNFYYQKLSSVDGIWNLFMPSYTTTFQIKMKILGFIFKF